MKVSRSETGLAAILLFAVAAWGIGRELWIHRAMFTNILSRQRVRMDAKGDGHFGSSRKGHVHQGVDLLVNEGDPVASPIDGRIVRYSSAYQDTAVYRNIVIHGEGIEVKIMYATLAPGLHIGDPVRRGQLVGEAQAVSRKYGGPPMKDHLHVEARKIVGAELLNPEQLLRIA